MSSLLQQLWLVLGITRDVMFNVHLGHWAIGRNWGSIELNHPGQLDSVALQELG